MTNKFRSPIFELSHDYVSQSAALSPIAATSLGIAGYNDKLDDFSLAGTQRSADLTKRTLGTLSMLDPIDEIDEIAKSVLEERMRSSLALHDSRERHILWNVIASPVSRIRQVFELMPKQSAADIEAVTSRLYAVEAAHDSWTGAIEELAHAGKRTARRQVLAIAEQLATFSKGAYTNLVGKIDPSGKNQQLLLAAKAAEASCAKTSEWLLNTYLPLANPEDAVGEERYSLWSRFFTGANLNLKQTYEWGLEDLARIHDRMWKVAAKIKPTATSLREVADYLEQDERYLIHGEENLLKRLTEFIEESVRSLDGVYFDIDDRIKNCEARLAPTGAAAAPYYMGPSEDLSRPGTTWYPTLGKTKFGWWHIASTWYHEAVPGHHLQVATVAVEKERLSRFQRSSTFISGHGEGWALYAERFMDELGAFDDPGLEMGYLSAQAMRATRVVIDIGMHLGYTNPEGKLWNAETGLQAMINQALVNEDFARSEIDRYLGWPGQAIAYKVGERVWLRAREDAKNRLGGKFALKSFHNYALKLGPMGLDALEATLSRWQGN
jgi:uncharacterized protein (DUF885 family)